MLQNKIRWSTWVSILMLSSATHATMWCGYKDYFRINNETVPELHIMNVYADHNFQVQVIDPTSFEIQDRDCSLGYVYLFVMKNQHSWCRLDIKEDAFLVHPSVRFNCMELKYDGMTYEGSKSGAYAYTLHFK